MLEVFLVCRFCLRNLIAFPRAGGGAGEETRRNLRPPVLGEGEVGVPINGDTVVILGGRHSFGVCMGPSTNPRVMGACYSLKK